MANSGKNTSDKDIAELVKKAQDGDEGSFSKLYDTYFDRIYSFIYFRVHHKEVAEDLTEDVFIKAWTKITSVNSDSFGGWLYSIAKNKIIDHYRKHREIVDLAEIENIIEADLNIVEEADLKINQKLLLSMLRKLTPEQQIVMKLKFLEGLENEEISELISKSVGSIRVTQHRATQKLQEMFKKKENANLSNMLDVNNVITKSIKPDRSNAKE
jgi:RNA polymerase sigma-70 factor (ECF subfamily)